MVGVGRQKWKKIKRSKTSSSPKQQDMEDSTRQDECVADLTGEFVSFVSPSVSRLQAGKQHLSLSLSLAAHIGPIERRAPSLEDPFDY